MGVVFWFTGLSGAGKTTVASGAAAALAREGVRVKTLDGDDVRARHHRHLGFSAADILENNRLIAEMCADALADYDAILVPIISPLAAARRAAQARLGGAFRLVYFSAPLAHVETADVKGLYRRAREGEIADMIGVAETNPYEPPEAFDLELDISSLPEADCVARFVDYLRAEIGACNDVRKRV